MGMSTESTTSFLVYTVFDLARPCSCIFCSLQAQFVVYTYPETTQIVTDIGVSAQTAQPFSPVDTQHSPILPVALCRRCAYRQKLIQSKTQFVKDTSEMSFLTLLIMFAACGQTLQLGPNNDRNK